MQGTEIAQLFAKITADVGDFDKAMRGVDDKLSVGERTMQGFQQAGELAFKAIAVAVTTFSAVVATSVNAAANMEQGIADIGAMMALTADETAKLEEHILALGLDPNLKVSATEAADAVMALGTAGLSMTQIMGGASEATVLLANATGLKGGSGFASAANIATDVMAQFNITASDMNHAVDQIAGTTVASKFTIDDYRLAIGQAGGVAGSVGVTFEDFNADIAATASSFNSGSDAATSWKTYVQRLVPTTNEAKDKMIELGLATADGSSKFFDSSGKMKSAEERAALLASAFGGLSDSQKISAASTIFGTDAMRTALSLAEGGTPIITKMKLEIGKVDAEELAAKRMDTFKGSLEIARGVIETITISIGNKFLPVLRPLVDKFTELAQKWGPKVIDFFDSVATRIGTAIKSFTELKIVYEDGSGALMDFLKALGLNDELAQKIGKTYFDLRKHFDDVVTAVKLAVRPITDVIDKFFDWKDIAGAVAVLLAGPVLAAVGGMVLALVQFLAPIAAVAAAIAALRWAWENDFIGIRTFTLSSLQKMSDWFFNESGIWKGTWEDTLEYLKWWADGGWKNAVFFPIRSWLTKIGSEFQVFKLYTSERFAEWVQKIKDFFAGMYNDTIARLTNLKDRIISIWQAWIDPTVKEIDDWSARTLSSIHIWVGWGIRYFTEFKDWAIERFEAVLGWWDNSVQPWINAGRDTIQGLWDGIKQKWNDLSTWFSGAWSNLVDRFKNFFGIHSPSALFAMFGESMMQGLQSGITNAAQLPINAMDAISLAVQGKVTSMVSAVADSARTITNTIKSMPALPEGYWSTPVTPVTAPTPVVIPTPVATTPNEVYNGGKASAVVSFGSRDLDLMLNSLAAYVDVSDTLQDIKDFAGLAKSLLGTNAPSSSPEGIAVSSLLSGGLSNLSVDRVLSAIQLLIRKIDEQGLGSRFNISAAPDASLQQQTELEELVSYLNALYG